jgi:hypothetical protein
VEYFFSLIVQDPETKMSQSVKKTGKNTYEAGWQVMACSLRRSMIREDYLSSLYFCLPVLKQMRPELAHYCLKWYRDFGSWLSVLL